MTPSRPRRADLPARVEFREEGPREGFQIEPRLYPLADRAALVEALAETGLGIIQVASFVNPKKVPQMADAEALYAAIRRRPGVRYEALWLNEQGFRRAQAAQVDLDGKLTVYASDGLARLNNGHSAEDMLALNGRWLDLYAEAGIAPSRAVIVCAFGSYQEGDIPVAEVVALCRRVEAMVRGKGQHLPEITLADTVGFAHPEGVRRLVGELRAALPEIRVGLHLHDTRGLGAANVLAALEMGVDAFDSSVAGLGGCPFAAHGDRTAAGNICTEDMAFLCEEIGVATGLDLEALVEAARLAERIIGRPLGGHLMHSGTLSRYRARAAA
jgi:hydroxymethylglutaryl-CoA lyase